MSYKGQVFAIEALATVVLLAIALAFSAKVYEVDQSNWERYQPLTSKARTGAISSIYENKYNDRYFKDKNELYCSSFYGPGLPSRDGNINPNERVYCSFFGDKCLNGECDSGEENCATCPLDCSCSSGKVCCPATQSCCGGSLICCSDGCRSIECQPPPECVTPGTCCSLPQVCTGTGCDAKCVTPSP